MILLHPLMPFVTEEIYGYLPQVQAGQRPASIFDATLPGSAPPNGPTRPPRRPWRPSRRSWPDCARPARNWDWPATWSARSGWWSRRRERPRRSRGCRRRSGSCPAARSWRCWAEGQAARGPLRLHRGAGRQGPAGSRGSRRRRAGSASGCSARPSKAQAEAAKARAKLSNQGFVAKAPEAVVAEERARLAAAEAALDEVRRQYEERVGGRAGAARGGPPVSTCDIRTRSGSTCNGLERLGTRLGLERMQKLVEALGSPQKAYRTIHVVGTNGKTSTTRFISALLQAQGHRVGAYVSPHLVSLAERQMVDSVPSSDEEFCDLVDAHPAGGGEGGEGLRPGRAAHAVRGAHRGRVPLLQGAGLRRGRHRGGLGRPAGRHRGHLVRRAGAHQHRPGAHRAARATRRSAILQGEGGRHPAERQGGRRGAGPGAEGRAQGDLRRPGGRVPLLRATIS